MTMANNVQRLDNAPLEEATSLDGWRFNVKYIPFALSYKP